MAAPMLEVGGATNPEVVQQHQEAAPMFYYGDVVESTAQPGLLGTVVYQVEDPDDSDANDRSEPDDDDVDGMDVDAAAVLTIMSSSSSSRRSRGRLAGWSTWFGWTPRRRRRCLPRSSVWWTGR